jgi:hypothetical protein
MPKGYKLDMAESYPIQSSANGTSNATSNSTKTTTEPATGSEETTTTDGEVATKHAQHTEGNEHLKLNDGQIQSRFKAAMEDTYPEGEAPSFAQVFKHIPSHPNEQHSSPNN